MNRVTDAWTNGLNRIQYTYDNYGKLTGATQGSDTYSYTYDVLGNITEINNTVGGTTTTKTLTYDTVWKDRLVSVNGKALEYDETAPGLPTTYQNGNKTYSFGWDEQGNLDSAIAGVVPVTFGYDTSGLRQFKSSRGVRHDYYYDGDRLIAETIGDDKYLLFHYDETDSIFAITYGYDNTEYTYQLLKNLQGDVVAILNYDNSIIATYEYDAWGNLLSIKNENGIDITSSTGYFANINPIRYRSYYYDTETKFYYLQSRYYDPANCRFISMDEPTVVTADFQNGNQYNLFAYAFNDPINMSDDNGYWPKWAKNLAKVAVGAAAIAGLAVATVCTGGAAGVIAGAALTGAISGGVSGAVTGAVGHRISTGSWEGAGEAALNGAADGYMTGAISGAISGGFTSRSCFVAGTSILTSAGKVAIEYIKTGDLVWASDPETGDVSLKQVVQTFINESDELIHVYVNGEEIITTPEHPFYSPVKGWTSAAHLRAGDILVLVNGSYVVVEQVQYELLESPIAVYNFEVEDYHTYYVGDTSVLVHNLCSNPGGRHGGSAHRNKVSSIKDDLSSKGWDVLPNEKRISVGNGRYRYPDVIATKNGQTRFYQVGRTTSAGRPVSREVRALRDLSGYADDIFFVPYD